MNFVVEKTNLVVGVYGVFGLVYYRNSNFRRLLMSLLSLCLNGGTEGEVFVSSDSLFQARVTEGRKELRYCCDSAGIV